MVMAVMKSNPIQLLFGRILGAAGICLFLSAGLCMTAFASVTTTKEATGPADTIYVAGNPDSYPIEYYDPDSESYRGVIPGMLETISEKTGISFVYIAAGDKNEQRRLSRNNQAELITAISLQDTSCTVTEKYPVLTIRANGEDETYCVGFTKIASGELIEAVTSAFSEISDEEKMGILVSYTAANKPMPRSSFWLYIGISFAAAVVLMLLIILIVQVRRKRRERKRDMVDPLTGVGNDGYYVYAFTSLISEQARHLYNVTYIGFDVEKSESLWGKQACEDIQKYAAVQLNAGVASAEYLSRIKNGVFAFVFQAENEERMNERMWETVMRLNRYLGEFNPDWGRLFSAGVCHLADHPDCNAETAVYSAKQGYIHARNRSLPCLTGSGEHLAQSRKNAKLRGRISEALKNGEFKIYMQFITDSSAADICGAEVLSRWQNPEYGLLRPHEYIELLKETGKIVAHDYEVFSNVCRQLEHWSEPPYDKLFLTCNFTRISVSETDFADRIRELSEQYQFDHSRLVIEITEDSLAKDSEAAASNIKVCSAMGFKIAIDDMGTGFSSFSDLYDNDIDVVKIERDFISACTSERRYRMLGDIVSLVHNTGAKVICEGIENKEQQEMIKEIGCDMMQGFYYSRVLPMGECERFITIKSIVGESVL